MLAELFLKLKDKLEGRAFTPYDKEPKSALAEILLSILNETEYDKQPNSRIAELLLELKAELENYAELTASGAIANFTTSVVKPLVNLTAYFNATQEAGTPTPSEPKAISGVSAVNVFKCGSNILDLSALSDNVYYSLNSDGSLKVLDADNRGWANCPVCGFLKAGTYNLIRSIESGTCDIRFSNDNYSSSNKLSGNNLSRTVTLTEDSYFKIKLGYGLTSENYPFNCFYSINAGSDALPFEQYNGSTTLINLGGTYYGGQVEIDKNGHRRLKVTSVKKKLSDYAWTKGDLNVEGRVFYHNFSNEIVEPSVNCKCDSFEQIVWGNWNTLARYQYMSASYFVFCVEDNYATVNDMLAVYGDVEFTLILKTPYYIDLTDGEPITAFNGVNNVYNDSGDTSVTYLALISDNITRSAKARATLKAEKLKAKEIEEQKEQVVLDPVEVIKEKPTKGA